MSTQESLTFLFDAIALSFIAIAFLDFGRRVIALYNQVFTTQKQLPSINSQPQALPQLPDPWLLPVATSAPVKLAQEQQKPILLLAPAKAVDDVELPSTQSTTRELLTGVDVDTLKLRDARKLAKALGIAQKVNGRDQKLAFLQSQIKAKLQQETLLQPETIAVVREELIAC